jgi:L-amino acid N-acyltransferase YncA
MTGLIRDQLATKDDLCDFATKNDLCDVESRLEQKIENTRVEIDQRITQLDNRMTRLENVVDKLYLKIVVTLGGMMGVGIAALVAIDKIPM